MGAVFTVVHAVTTRHAVVNRCALPLGMAAGAVWITIPSPSSLEGKGLTV